MPKDDSDGLLSRVTKFVRPAGTAPEEPESTELSREAMRQMLERRRRNDLVRQREFAALRKMRRVSGAAPEAMLPTAPAETRGPGEPSRPHTDIKVPDTRLQTLRKIEEIEHEMSATWPRRAGRAPALGAGAATPAPTPAPSPVSFPASAPVVASAPNALPAATAAPRARAVFRPTDYPTTTGEPPSGFMAVDGGGPSPTQVGTEGVTAEMGLDATSRSTGPARAMGPAAPATTGYGDAAVPEHLRPDPQIEAAAILFGSGADAGALNSLMTSLQSGEGHEETWRALLDMYRATGQRQAFDALAAQLRTHFEPPPWRDLRAGARAPEPARPGVLQLSGRLVGNIDDALKGFDPQVQGWNQIEISCAEVERIDFVAAGVLLNWVIAQRRAKRAVRIVDAHRLVAAFLRVVGLAAHADIQLRVD